MQVVQKLVSGFVGLSIGGSSERGQKSGMLLRREIRP